MAFRGGEREKKGAGYKFESLSHKRKLAGDRNLD